MGAVMADFIWNSRKMFRVLFETQAAFRLNRSSRKEIRLKEKTIAAKLLNLSAGGCALESPNFLPAGVRLNIFLDRDLLLAPKDRPKKRHFSRITGVVRTSRQMPNRKYRLGVQFEKVATTDVKLIRAVVDAQERREDKRLTFPQ